MICPASAAPTRSQNTDLTTVTLTQSADEVRDVDELPFGAAIAVGVDMLMTSWAVYRVLDTDFPAGLGAAIVQGELRHRLGFRGVTITDALEARAVAPFGDTGARSVLAAQAGMDVQLCSVRDVTQGTAAVQAVAAALQGFSSTPSTPDRRDAACSTCGSRSVERHVNWLPPAGRVRRRESHTELAVVTHPCLYGLRRPRHAAEPGSLLVACRRTPRGCSVTFGSKRSAVRK